MSTNRPRIAVIGAGAMGSLHVRTVAESDLAELALIVDTDTSRARAMAADYGAEWSTDPERATDVDAAIVATPAWNHAQVALPLIEAGIPLLIEKPLAMNEEEAGLLVARSEAASVPIMCGFVERFNPVIAATIERLEGAPLLHVTSTRHSPPNPRADVSVVHDLLIHDLDLVATLSRRSVTEPPLASAWTPPHGPHPEVVDCTVRIPGGGIASLSASRAAQRKIREITITTALEQVELDLMRRTMTVYRHVHHDLSPIGRGYRSDTVVDIPFVRQEGEPIALQFRHFVGLVKGAVDPQLERRSIVPAHLLAFAVERSLSRVTAVAS